MNEDIMVRLSDIGKVLIEYIGTEDFERAVECTKDDGRSGFIGGLGMAGCLIMARCEKYIGMEEKESVKWNER